MAVPALGFARRRQQDGAVPHRGRPASCASGAGSDLPDPDLAYLVEGDRRVRRVHPRPAVGAAVRVAQPRGDDGPRRRPASAAWLGVAVESSTSEINCHHNFTERETHFGRGGVVVAARVRSSARRGARADPGLDGRPRPTSCAARATRSRCTRRRTARAATTRARRPAGVHPGQICDERDGAASSAATPTRSSTRSRRPTRPIDVVMARCRATSSRSLHDLRQIVNVKGD